MAKKTPRQVNDDLYRQWRLAQGNYDTVDDDAFVEEDDISEEPYVPAQYYIETVDGVELIRSYDDEEIEPLAGLTPADVDRIYDMPSVSSYEQLWRDARDRDQKAAQAKIPEELYRTSKDWQCGAGAACNYDCCGKHNGTCIWRGILPSAREAELRKPYGVSDSIADPKDEPCRNILRDPE
jgi:hypothetical protein